MDLSEAGDIEDVYLNVFPLFVKPDYQKDARFSLYLETYISFLTSDLVEELPGVDPLYISSLLASWRNSLEICKASEAKSLASVVAKTQAALNALTSGNFIVLHFPNHSCDVVVFPDKQSSDHFLFVPMELRRTNFSTAEPIKESGYTRAWCISLPKTMLQVKKSEVTDDWLRLMADLQIGSVADFPGVFPFGNGGAKHLPDDRKAPMPTYIFEWLLPKLTKNSIAVEAPINVSKTISSQRKFVGQGIPWRRSVHWNSIRFATALAQRWHGYSLEQYKVLQLGFKTWLLEHYTARHTDRTRSIVEKQAEMLTQISWRSSKLLAMSAAMETMVNLVANRCDSVSQLIDSFPQSILEQKETESILPSSLNLQSVSGQFYLPDSTLQSLKQGSNKGLASLKENISTHVSPILFVSSVNATKALDLLRSTSEQLKQAMATIRSQKADLAVITVSSMLHGTENFIYRLFDCVCKENITDLGAWAVSLRELANDYAAFITKLQNTSAERRSREVLALWCLIALIDNVARRSWPQLFEGVGMALPVALLESLTFRERSLMQTAASLIALKSSFGARPGLFDYSSPGATQHFAVKFFNSLEGSEMQSCLATERHRERERQTALQNELNAAKKEYEALQYQACDCTYYWDGSRRTTCSRCMRRSALASKRTQISHPLPADDQIAQEVIFFACIPDILQSYGAIIYHAYTLHGTKLKQPTTYSQDLVAWAFAKNVQLPTLKNSPVSLVSHHKTLESNSHYKNTSTFTVEDIYPNCNTRFVAIGNDKSCVSSFQYNIAMYQYSLVGALQNLSWIGNANHTENLVLASQHRMPTEMDKRDFIGYGRVRAAPNLQIRELIMMLERTAESELKSIDLLILTQRVLFEMGPTSLSESECKWTWKHDLFSEMWLERLYRLLVTKHAQIQPNWQSHAIALLIIEISVFTLQFGYRAVLTKLLGEVRNTILEWIKEVEQELFYTINKAENPTNLRLLLIKLHAYLLLGSLEVTEEDLQHRSELSRLKSVCTNLLTSEIHSLLTLVDAHVFNFTVNIHKLITLDPLILHRMVAKVGIDIVPDMAWHRVESNNELLDWYSNECYMINPISGLILCDGLTVSELPSVIMQKPLYKQVMRNANFIVQRVDNEYITSHGARKFKFGLWNEYPFIHEQQSNHAYTLLPSEFLHKSGLPLPLIQMTHWIDFDRRVIEFRCSDFHDTSFSYEMNLDTKECFVNDQQRRQLLNAYDEHFQQFAELLTRIAPIEQQIYSKNGSDEFKVDLPCNLTFTLHDNGVAASNNYPGYMLATTQLVPTFPLFSNYLFIKPQSSFSTKLPLVLVLHEGVIYPYEFDEVHQRLIPPTTLARLVLAYVYAQSMCAIDPLMRATGLHQAFLLLQGCWQNSPYATPEMNVLQSLINMPEESPLVYTIKLFIYYLVEESNRVSFLHSRSSPDWCKIIQQCTKQYFKYKHILPTAYILDSKVEEMLHRCFPPKDKVRCNGLYFARVPAIFFSKDTLPSTFKIGIFFSEETTISALVGDLPSKWSKFGQLSKSSNVFFWFLRQIYSAALPRDQILTQLTFLAHNALLKGEPLELLNCLYCALMVPGFSRPADQLIYSNNIYKTEAVQQHEVIKLMPSDESYDETVRLWTIYSSNYLDYNWRPKSFFHETKDAFSTWYPSWKWNFLQALTALHNMRYIGRLFGDYCMELKRSIACNIPTIAFHEAELLQIVKTSYYAWPTLKVVALIELDLLNKHGNGFEFFDKQISQLYEGIGVEDSAIDLVSLKNEEEMIHRQLDSIKRDRSKAEERKALDARLDKIDEMLRQHELTTPLVQYPLTPTSSINDNNIHARIHKELQNSYQKHIHSQQLVAKIVTDMKVLLNLQKELELKRDSIWKEIERFLTHTEHPLFKMWQKSNLFMKPHQRIIPSLIKGLSNEYRFTNHCLEETEILQQLALHFALLQAHSIKLGRIIDLLNDWHLTSDLSDRQGFESQLFSELSDKREWNPRQHPEWLIFEMERRVCIRSIQVEIATKMLEEKNIVLQLNMGEGKSKVIVPILCSVLANGQTLVRVNVLPSLFHEVHSYLKLALGNMLGKRIYTFPFHRNVPLTIKAMKELQCQLNECKLVGGIILATPEHRESLELKHREVLWQMAQAKFDISLSDNDFKGVIDVPILELLDESDEILRHKYQLIYTLGDQQLIEGGRSRWKVHLALIRCIFMANLYQTNREAVPVEYLEDNLNGALRLESLYQVMTLFKADFYFNPSHESQVLPAVRLINDSFYEQLRQALFKVFQLGPVWRLIAKGRSPDELKQIEEFILNNYSNTIDGDKKCIATKNKLLQDKSIKVPVLTLRGLLSFDVLKASLLKRHRIHYGIDPRRAVPMAVPFRGKDTPADRVEFGQPDMAITLTILAHSTGIDSDAVKSCFVNLKTKGINEQREIYCRWYVISKPIMNSKYVTLLEKIEAVNVENVNMMEHLTQYFRRNYEVIAYYLNKFVLPKGTRLFPEKIIANSWDLAKSSDKVVGFSGTDDTKHTLPLYVKQVALPLVESTNGKMIDVLTNEKFNNRQYKSLPKEFESERILQEMCSHDNWNVLIDSGALIEGMSNREVVVKVLEICPRFETGIFFDESNRLALIDRHGNSSQLNSIRPLEHSCFTYLDDIHTRGTDLPFPTKSHAFVTVATGITKDKLMQACMRMRKLVVGLHNVTFWGTSEVTMKIQQMVVTRDNMTLAENAITSVHILEWVIENTIKAQEEAIITFASQGFHHYASSEALKLLRQNSLITPGDIINAVALKEILDIEEMYGIPLKSVNMKDHINQHGTRTKGELLAREIDLNLSEIARPLYDNLIQHSCQLVPERKTVRVCGSVNEEYERELQQEVEEERHRQLPANALPCSEDLWDFAQINDQQFMSRALSGAIRVLQVLPLKSVFCGASLHTEWNESRVFARNDAVCNIFVTKNFVSTVQSNALSDYIRPIDVVIKFNGAKTQYLLVSLFEANVIINYVNAMSEHVEFHHLRYMHGKNNDEHRCIALLKLLNGNLSYSQQEKTALMMLLSVVPERMDFIDQSVIGVPLFPELWHETWNTLCRTTVLDKHNGFVEEREDLVPPSGPHNASMIRLITTVLNHSRLFSSKPSKFLHTLLILRDTIRDYNYSDLHSLFGNL